MHDSNTYTVVYTTNSACATQIPTQQSIPQTMHARPKYLHCGLYHKQCMRDPNTYTAVYTTNSACMTQTPTLQSIPQTIHAWPKYLHCGLYHKQCTHDPNTYTIVYTTNNACMTKDLYCSLYHKQSIQWIHKNKEKNNNKQNKTKFNLHQRNPKLKLQFKATNFSPVPETWDLSPEKPQQGNCPLCSR